MTKINNAPIAVPTLAPMTFDCVKVLLEMDSEDLLAEDGGTLSVCSDCWEELGVGLVFITVLVVKSGIPFRSPSG